MRRVRRIHIRTARHKAGLTQVQLSARAGVDQKTISRLETKPDVRPSFQTQTSIAGVLGVDPMALVFGPDPRTKIEVTP